MLFNILIVFVRARTRLPNLTCALRTRFLRQTKSITQAQSSLTIFRGNCKTGS